MKQAAATESETWSTALAKIEFFLLADYFLM